MVEDKVLGQIKIIEIKDNDNGTCSIIYEIPKDLRDYFKGYFGWKRWSSKKFNEFFLEALMKNAETLERESKNTAADNQHRIDVLDNRPVQSDN